MQISLHSAKLAINFTAKIGKSGKYWFFFFFKEDCQPLLPINPNQKRH